MNTHKQEILFSIKTALEDGGGAQDVWDFLFDDPEAVEHIRQYLGVENVEYEAALKSLEKISAALESRVRHMETQVMNDLHAAEKKAKEKIKGYLDRRVPVLVEREMNPALARMVYKEVETQLRNMHNDDS